MPATVLEGFQRMIRVSTELPARWTQIEPFVQNSSNPLKRFETHLHAPSTFLSIASMDPVVPLRFVSVLIPPLLAHRSTHEVRVVL